MAVQGEDGTTRAFNSFALRTVPLDANRCRLEVVDYFDMRGWFPTCASPPYLCPHLSTTDGVCMYAALLGCRSGGVAPE